MALRVDFTKGYPVRPLGPAFRVFGQGALLAVPVPVVIFLEQPPYCPGCWPRAVLAATFMPLGVTGMPPSWSAFLWLESRCLPMDWPGCSPHLPGFYTPAEWMPGNPRLARGGSWEAITAAILGGTSLKGGQGTILGTVFGTLLLLMAAVSNGLSLLNVSGWLRGSPVVGAIVLAAVLGDLLRRRY